MERKPKMEKEIAVSSIAENAEEVIKDHDVVDKSSEKSETAFTLDGGGEKPDSVGLPGITEVKKPSSVPISELETVETPSEFAKPLDPKVFTNIDPNSEDIELKWDDDADDVVERDIDDKIPGLIENLELTKPEESIDGDIREADGEEAMDVDDTEGTASANVETEIVSEIDESFHDTEATDTVSKNENTDEPSVTAKLVTEDRSKDNAESITANILENTVEIDDKAAYELIDEPESTVLILEAESIDDIKISSPTSMTVLQPLEDQDKLPVETSVNSEIKEDKSESKIIDILPDDPQEDITELNIVESNITEDIPAEIEKDNDENICPAEEKLLTSKSKTLDNLTTDIDDNILESADSVATNQIDEDNTTNTKDSMEIDELNKTDKLLPEINEKLVTKNNESIPSPIKEDNVITNLEMDDSGASSFKIVVKPGEEILTDKTTKDKDTESMEPEPSTSKADLKEDMKTDTIMSEAVSSTSSELEQMAPDASDEVPELEDCLGLLAESTRRIDEEDDEDDDGDVDDDEDGDDDHDDESNSNPQTADHSEDSNAQTSETDAGKNQTCNIQISNVTFTGKLDPKPLEDKDDELDDAAVADDDKVSDEKMDQDKDDENVGKESKPDEPHETESPSTSEIVDAEKTKSKDSPTPETVKSMDIDAVKPSADISIEPSIETNINSILQGLLVKEQSPPNMSKDSSPSKVKNLGISTAENVVNYVDLEESSSEDDIQEVGKEPTRTTDADDETVTDINLPKDLDVMSASSNKGASEIESTGDEIVIKGVPKAAPAKTARLNTSEISIKTTTSAPESKLVIPEVESVQSQEPKSPKPKFGLEVFSIDSDEEDNKEIKDTKEIKAKSSSPKKSPKSSPDKRKRRRCVNPNCNDAGLPGAIPDPHVLRFYDVKRKQPYVCQTCADVVYERTWCLVQGLKSDLPLLRLDMSRPTQELYEISDSDSDSESVAKDKLTPSTAAMLEEHLADVLNDTWRRYKLDERLNEAKQDIEVEMADLEEQCNEIDAMIRECQVSIDSIRTELYNTFPPAFKHAQPIEIYDTPFVQYTKPIPEVDEIEVRRSKRPKHYSSTIKPENDGPIEITNLQNNDRADDSKTVDDDNTDISVVKLSAEAAPAWLPPPSGAPCPRPPPPAGATVYAMKPDSRAWLKAKVLETVTKHSASNSGQFSVYRVRFEKQGIVAQVSARNIAYYDPAPVRLTIGTRVIALFKDDTGAKRKAYYAGVVAEMANPVNDYRYLIFFDDGYAQYVTHAVTRVVCESAAQVWQEVHETSRQFVRDYIQSYPERPMVRLFAGQTIKTEWSGKWWVTKVIQVDASLVQVHFECDSRTEWIYRGSTRLAPLYLELHGAGDKPRSRHLPRSHNRQNMPYVEYTRPDEPSANNRQQQNEEIRRQRAVAKKSTSLPAPPPHAHSQDTVTSRVVFYTPKAAVRPHKMVPHKCSVRCRRSDVLPLKELRTYNPLARPLLSGWERQIVRFKGRKEIVYRAPCGRRLKSISEVHLYLRLTHSEMSVDLFDFALNTHCLAEFVLNKCFVSKKDLSHGKENVPVPCVNYVDNSLPEFCSYNTERTPTAGVPLNLDPEFLCGCDCIDDCMDKSKCACWKMTLDGARTIGLDGDEVGYVYKRLLDPVPSGIYECNSRCKCKQTCLNRVAQHPLQLKLQVFKTQNRGWGIRALNDVPRGAFLCVYAGNLLTDATANLDGLNEGDEYLAELDYIEVVEAMKEGFEEDVPAADKLLDQKQSESDSEEESSSDPGEDKQEKNDIEDDDFRPAYEIPHGVLEFNKRLRKRDKRKKDKEIKEKESEKKGDDEFITISDDEDLREPQNFNAQEGIGGNDLVSKYKSVRALYGKDEACYIMDAKVQGNIGRYLNHSCQPNVFVQNVFVDTHDPRFPWVSFFALSHIRAGTELTWNYNYDVGSVPGKTLHCHCGAPNCRGRLL